MSNPEKRDIYNRYNIYYGGVKGDIKDIIDPRTQEFDLIMHISLILLSWGLFIYIMTIPKAYQVARTWCTPLLFILVVLEIVFKLGDLEIPSILYQNATPPYMDSWTMILPSYLTEYELITYIYWNIPCIVLLSQCISAYGYVDPDECCHNVIKGLLKQQEVGILLYMQQLFSDHIIEVNSFICQFLINCRLMRKCCHMSTIHWH